LVEGHQTSWYREGKEGQYVAAFPCW